MASLGSGIGLLVSGSKGSVAPAGVAVNAVAIANAAVHALATLGRPKKTPNLPSCLVPYGELFRVGGLEVSDDRVSEQGYVGIMQVRKHNIPLVIRYHCMRGAGTAGGHRLELAWRKEVILVCGKVSRNLDFHDGRGICWDKYGCGRTHRYLCNLFAGKHVDPDGCVHTASDAHLWYGCREEHIDAFLTDSIDFAKKIDVQVGKNVKGPGQFDLVTVHCWVVKWQQKELGAHRDATANAANFLQRCQQLIGRVVDVLRDKFGVNR
jgi:hypothetical protein